MQWSLVNCKHNYDILPGEFKWKQSQLYQMWIIAWCLLFKVFTENPGLASILTCKYGTELREACTYCHSEEWPSYVYSCHPAKFLINRLTEVTTWRRSPILTKNADESAGT